MSARPCLGLAGVALAAALVLGLCGRAAAQSDAETRQARAAFEEAVRLMQQERYSDAIPLLDRSRGIREVPPVVFNLGLAYRATGDFGRAMEALRRLVALTEGNDRYAEMRARALQLIGEIAASRSRIAIVVRGGARSVTLDAQTLGAADGTFERDVDPGRHRVAASRPGFEPVSRDVDVRAGEVARVELDASQNPRLATLRLAVDPAGAEVRIDGAVVGTGNLERQLPGGRHRVEVSARGYRTSRFVVSLEPGTTLERDVPLAAPERRTAGDDDRGSSGGVLTRWWFWTAVGAVVVGGAVVAIVASQPGTAPYEGGSLGMTVVALDR